MEIEADIKDISYGSLLFRHIDRILGLTAKDFVNDEAKLFTFEWAVRLLKGAITKDVGELPESESTDKKNYTERFRSAEKDFTDCVNLLSAKGYLFRKVSDGDYYETS